MSNRLFKNTNIAEMFVTKTCKNKKNAKFMIFTTVWDNFLTVNCLINVSARCAIPAPQLINLDISGECHGVCHSTDCRVFPTSIFLMTKSEQRAWRGNCQSGKIKPEALNSLSQITPALKFTLKYCIMPTSLDVKAKLGNQKPSTT